jgi:hypothetical protein
MAGKDNGGGNRPFNEGFTNQNIINFTTQSPLTFADADRNQSV